MCPMSHDVHARRVSTRGGSEEAPSELGRKALRGACGSTTAKAKSSPFFSHLLRTVLTCSGSGTMIPNFPVGNAPETTWLRIRSGYKSGQLLSKRGNEPVQARMTVRAPAFSSCVVFSCNSGKIASFDIFTDLPSASREINVTSPSRGASCFSLRSFSPSSAPASITSA